MQCVDQFHRYMNTIYPERGLPAGLPRPLYEIPEELIYRSKSGEVLVHRSHVPAGGIEGCQPIHAEANPWSMTLAFRCATLSQQFLTPAAFFLSSNSPDRYLFVFDFVNIIANGCDTYGKKLPSEVSSVISSDAKYKST
eukprot:SAG31_NODE_5625_length_2417_cov_1.578947_1_plen_139_part_00